MICNFRALVNMAMGEVFGTLIAAYIRTIVC
jgi:hypothetical protein